MTETHLEKAAVSVSRSLVGEKPRHLPTCRASAEAPPETVNLKALARRVLARDTRRDGNGVRVFRDAPITDAAARQPDLGEQTDAASIADGGSGDAASIADGGSGSDVSRDAGETIFPGVSLSRVLGRETPETPRRKHQGVARNDWRLHGLRALAVPSGIPEAVVQLADAARQHGVVLVADGITLDVVEYSDLPPGMVDALQDNAGSIIALLRHESNARCNWQVFDPPEH
jgi:hypothetical protein